MVDPQVFEALTAPNVSIGRFLELTLPSGVQRYHNGYGTATVEGEEWTGVSDPFAGQVVSISDIQDPRFGKAPNVEISLAVSSLDFFRSVKEMASEIEGSRAQLYIAAFNAETEKTITGLIRVFDGFLSAPTFTRQGIGTRSITLNVESFWHSQNYPFGGKWNDAAQQRRFPGDLGFEFSGVQVTETWR